MRAWRGLVSTRKHKMQEAKVKVNAQWAVFGESILPPRVDRN